MSSTTKSMPTLGYFNKVICDCLGIWSSEKNDILFKVPATEEERRKKLKEAFDSIRKDDGSYGGLNELLSITTKTSPKTKEIIRKNRTIQDYTNYLSKEDFYSYHEFIEFNDYINIVISDKHDDKLIARISSEIYSLSMQHYREFVREHATKPGYELDSYLFFIKNILVNVVNTSVNVFSSTTLNISKKPSDHIAEKTSLRSFVDAVIDLCNVSLHQLHKFHEVKLNDSKSSDQKIWNSDLKSQAVNTKSKQIIDRLNRNSKLKWDIFYNEIKPLISILPEEVDEKAFLASAYSAYVIHNLNIHTQKIAKESSHDVPTWEEIYPSVTDADGHYLTLSDWIDGYLNKNESLMERTTHQALETYEYLVQKWRSLDSSLIGKFDFPSTSEFVYSPENYNSQIQYLKENIAEIPIWMNEWKLAKNAVSSGKYDSGLQHYKKALQSARYTSGPLFIALYIDICAFCKYQYKELSLRNEVHIFDRFFEPLGAEASAYAGLLEYTPNATRDPENLMAVVSEKLKNRQIIQKIDAKTATFHSLVSI